MVCEKEKENVRAVESQGTNVTIQSTILAKQLAPNGVIAP